MKLPRRFDSCVYHRNGSFGAGYFALQFTLGKLRLGAIVFDQAEHVAILDDAGQSYRCEDFEDDLRAFIASPEGQEMAFGAQRRRVANDR